MGTEEKLVRERKTFDVVQRESNLPSLSQFALSLFLSSRSLFSNNAVCQNSSNNNTTTKQPRLTARLGGSRRPRPSQSPKSTRRASFPGWPARAPTGGGPCPSRAGPELQRGRVAAGAKRSLLSGWSRTTTTTRGLLLLLLLRRGQQRHQRRRRPLPQGLRLCC